MNLFASLASSAESGLPCSLCLRTLRACLLLLHVILPCAIQSDLSLAADVGTGALPTPTLPRPVTQCRFKQVVYRRLVGIHGSAYASESSDASGVKRVLHCSDAMGSHDRIRGPLSLMPTTSIAELLQCSSSQVHTDLPCPSVAGSCALSRNQNRASRPAPEDERAPASRAVFKTLLETFSLTSSSISITYITQQNGSRDRLPPATQPHEASSSSELIYLAAVLRSQPF